MRPRPKTFPRAALAAVAVAGLLAAPAVPATAAPGGAAAPGRGGSAAVADLSDVIPLPASVAPSGRPVELGPGTLVRVQAGSPEAAAAAQLLVDLLRPSTGFRLPVVPTDGPDDASRPLSGISLLTDGADPALGDEGYVLEASGRSVVLRAATREGLLHAVQTLRQLLPPAVEARDAQPGPWLVPGGRVEDRPRFAYRGAMLDVARHFMTVEEVQGYVDSLAAYKVNHLHLHLTDDQGWRIEIPGWPRLTEVGAATEVGGGPGGSYTQEDYAAIVAYAAERGVTVVPEVDLPGHANAALVAYPELTCDGVAPEPYTGIEVGFSTLCVDKEVTYDFVGDVVRALAAATPGEYLHIGGDEALVTTEEEYARFMRRVLPLVEATGKTAVGWQELLPLAAGPAGGGPVTVGQYWVPGAPEQPLLDSLARGNRVVMSPADHAYLDMKYAEGFPLGLQWAGFTGVEDAFAWDPATYAEGIGEQDVLGVEAAIFSETLEDLDDVETMAFPRLPGIAEIGWSPRATHDWATYRERLALQGPRWERRGVDYYRSPEVPWAG
ncbi:beta-N-acetylhexosaminidase [Pseudokineococcus basanitobsidens]|uniref:beta-N-acetylhexosaminidase n=1 Tax=Pseudokineococcus basanitobsidens TaxID=1926649 RepID=A0ABU8RFD5_9ACTN